MNNFESNRVKLIESLKRLDFAVAELIKNRFAIIQTFQLEQTNLIQENFELRRKIEILSKENQNLKKIYNECMSDVDFAVKIVENIIIRLKNEDKS